MKLEFQPVLVASGEEGEGRLVLRDGYLVAVLVKLSPSHADKAGRWFLEKGFGPLDTPTGADFADLDEAAQWLRARMADGFSGRYWADPSQRP